LLATMVLIGKYTFNKLLNRDPWPAVAIHEEVASQISIFDRISTWWKLQRMRKGTKK